MTSPENAPGKGPCPSRVQDTHVQPVGKDKFRNAMARLSAAVNIVTTDGPFGRAGFTASAVCSVTDAPPTLLVCVNRDTSVHQPVSRNGALCVNTLSAGDKHLSRIFAAKVPMTERFAATSWSTLLTGAPVLGSAIVSFDCKVVRVQEVGTHDVLFCEVAAIALGGSDEAALLYYNRQYHEVGRVVATPGQDIEFIDWQ
jgi:flavin reductase